MTGSQRIIAGRYRLIDELGQGGMGTVWRAHDDVLDRFVAIKEVTFPPGVSEQERDVLRERTRREGRAAARLDHPNAVTIYDVTEQDGVPFLVMELLQARTLAETISSDGPLSPHRTAEVGLAVLGALEAAHAQGVVHRDVKPGNVLLRTDGSVVLTDFGIAMSVGDSSLTSTGLVLGSPSYIAPERAQGEQVGPPSDLWSLGATLFTAVEGRPPYDRGEPLLTLNAVISGEHEPFERAGQMAPVLGALLTSDPLERIDAAQTRAALLSVITAPAPVVDLPQPEPAAPSTSDRTQALSVSPPSRPRRSRKPLVAVGILAAAALGAALSVPALTSHHDAPSAAAGSHPSATPGSATPTTGASPASTGSRAQTAGFVNHSTGSGRLAVPASYTASTYGGFPQYRDPSTGRTLRLSSTAPGGGGPDALQDRRNQARYFAGKHSGYHEIGIEKIDYRGLDAADWEFTYTEGGATLHALSRVFVQDGRGYSLFFQTRASDDWSAARAEFERTAATFQP